MNSTFGLRFILVICIINVIIFLTDLHQTNANPNPQANKSDHRSANSATSNSGNKSTNNNNEKNVSIHKEVKNVNVNNEENTNISMKEKNKFNSQLAQIVINMPKQKVLRKSRRPTDEEKRLWFKIKALYEKSRENPDSDAFRHLGIVIDGLNPKYIATFRLWKILNSDSVSPYVPADPLPSPLGSVEKFEFSAEKPIASQLGELASKLKELVVWDLEGLEKLANTPDRELIPVELVVKRALLCASNQHFCPQTDTIQDEASKKMDARGVLTAVGHDPTKKRAKPNLEKLIEDATNGDSDDDLEIEDPDEPDPSSMFPDQGGQEEDEDGGQEEARVPVAPAAPQPPVKSRSRKSNPKAMSKSPSMSRESRPKSHPKHPTKGASKKQLVETSKHKSIVANHVDHDSPLSPESLLRLNRMRNSERFKSKLQFIRGEQK